MTMTALPGLESGFVQQVIGQAYLVRKRLIRFREHHPLRFCAHKYQSVPTLLPIDAKLCKSAHVGCPSVCTYPSPRFL